MTRYLLALVIPASLFIYAGCGSCDKKEELPPPTPIEEVLTEAVGQWEVGRWCEYRLMSRGGRESEIFVALTGSENVSGDTYFWLEVVAERDDRKVISKALVPQLDRVSFLESGKDLTKESKRFIVKVGEDRAVELPLQELQLLQEALELVGQGPDLNEVFGGGADVDAVEAGTVKYDTLSGKKLPCEKLILKKGGREVGYAYACEDVPVFGIAYSEHEKGTLELVDYGDSGAMTAITEEPEKLDLVGIATGLKDFGIK
jgi:hypothetical protein